MICYTVANIAHISTSHQFTPRVSNHEVASVQKQNWKDVKKIAAKISLS